MKYLYQCRKAKKQESCLKCNVFTLGIQYGFFLPGESKSIKLLATRILFQVITLGKAKIYFVSDEMNLIHTSYVIPKCVKFPFMNENDYEIGPCFTYPAYREKGIYPTVLNEICISEGNSDTIFYMIADETNVASIKGIAKAGFRKCGIVEVTGLMKRYVKKYSGFGKV